MVQFKIKAFGNEIKRNETNSVLTLFDLLKFRTGLKSLYATYERHIALVSVLDFYFQYQPFSNLPMKRRYELANH